MIGIGADQIELDVTLDRAPPAPLPLTLILALPRPKSLRKALHAATTLGIKYVHIIGSWRVDKSYWSTPRLSQESIRQTLLLGLEQAIDTAMPAVELHRRFRPFVEDRVPELIRGTRALLAHPGSNRPCPGGLRTSTTLAVGPEGGFNEFEVELFCRQGFDPVSVGPRLLRVEEVLPALVGKLFL